MEPTEPGLGDDRRQPGEARGWAAGRIAFVRGVGAGPGQLFTVAPGGGDPVALTAGSGLAGAWSPAWSPDARRVCFTAHLDTYSDLYLTDHDGSGLRQLTNGDEDDDFPTRLRR